MDPRVLLVPKGVCGLKTSQIMITFLNMGRIEEKSDNYNFRCNMASVCGNGSHSSYVGLNAKDSNNIQIIGILMILVLHLL